MTESMASIKEKIRSMVKSTMKEFAEKMKANGGRYEPEKFKEMMVPAEIKLQIDKNKVMELWREVYKKTTGEDFV